MGSILLVCAGGLAQAQVQVVPQGIEPVNGSSVDMGCISSLVDSGGVMVCGGCSYLTDGVSPDIDTSTSDWASQLVTVKRNEGLTPYLNYPLVLLTFGFDTVVSLTGIEMDLFLCPDWNIGAPSIFVYLNSDYDLVYHNGLQFVFSDNSPQSSCGSLSTVNFTGGSFLTGSYRTFHIVVDMSVDASIEWVHVGEVRFIGIDGPTCLQPTTLTSPLPTSCNVTLFPSLSLRKYSTIQILSHFPLLYTTTMPILKSFSSDTTISLSSSGNNSLHSVLCLLCLLSCKTPDTELRRDQCHPDLYPCLLRETYSFPF